MRLSQNRGHKVYLLVCFLVLLLWAVHGVAGTERGECLRQMVVANVNPDNIEAHRFLTEWYIKNGDYKKAVREIEAIIRLCPGPDPLSALDSWSQLPEEARLVIMGDVRASQRK